MNTIHVFLALLTFAAIPTLVIFRLQSPTWTSAIYSLIFGMSVLFTLLGMFWSAVAHNTREPKLVKNLLLVIASLVCGLIGIAYSLAKILE